MAFPAAFVISPDTLTGIEVTPLEHCDYETAKAVIAAAEARVAQLDAEANNYN